MIVEELGENVEEIRIDEKAKKYIPIGEVKIPLASITEISLLPAGGGPKGIWKFLIRYGTESHAIEGCTGLAIIPILAGVMTKGHDSLITDFLKAIEISSAPYKGDLND